MDELGYPTFAIPPAQARRLLIALVRLGILLVAGAGGFYVGCVLGVLVTGNWHHIVDGTPFS